MILNILIIWGFFSALNAICGYFHMPRETEEEFYDDIEC